MSVLRSDYRSERQAEAMIGGHTPAPLWGGQGLSGTLGSGPGTP